MRRLSIRWVDFYREKELRMGDTCVFQLLHSEPPMFMVYRKNQIDGSLTHLWKFLYFELILVMCTKNVPFLW